MQSKMKTPLKCVYDSTRCIVNFFLFPSHSLPLSLPSFWAVIVVMRYFAEK
jgi:hypothetical protein